MSEARVIANIITEIRELSSLDGVPRPVIEAVTREALRVFWDGRCQGQPQEQVRTLDELGVCECGAIAADCVSNEDVTLCPTCAEEALLAERTDVETARMSDLAEAQRDAREQRTRAEVEAQRAHDRGVDFFGEQLDHLRTLVAGLGLADDIRAAESRAGRFEHERDEARAVIEECLELCEMGGKHSGSLVARVAAFVGPATAEEARAELEADGIDVDGFLGRLSARITSADLAGLAAREAQAREIPCVVFGTPWTAAVTSTETFGSLLGRALAANSAPHSGEIDVFDHRGRRHKHSDIIGAAVERIYFSEPVGVDG